MMIALEKNTSRVRAQLLLFILVLLIVDSKTYESNPAGSDSATEEWSQWLDWQDHATAELDEIFFPAAGSSPSASLTAQQPQPPDHHLHETPTPRPTGVLPDVQNHSPQLSEHRSQAVAAAETPIHSQDNGRLGTLMNIDPDGSLGPGFWEARSIDDLFRSLAGGGVLPSFEGLSSTREGTSSKSHGGPHIPAITPSPNIDQLVNYVTPSSAITVQTQSKIANKQADKWLRHYPIKPFKTQTSQHRSQKMPSGKLPFTTSLEASQLDWSLVRKVDGQLPYHQQPRAPVQKQLDHPLSTDQLLESLSEHGFLMKFDKTMFAPHSPSDAVEIREVDRIKQKIGTLPNRLLILPEHEFSSTHNNFLQHNKVFAYDPVELARSQFEYESRQVRRRRLKMAMDQFCSSIKLWFKRWLEQTGIDFSSHLSLPLFDNFSYVDVIFPLYLFYVELICSIVPREGSAMSLAEELSIARKDFEKMTKASNESGLKMSNQSLEKVAELLKKRRKARGAVKVQPLLWTYVEFWMLTRRTGVFPLSPRTGTLTWTVKDFWNTIFCYSYPALHQRYLGKSLSSFPPPPARMA
ncbi:hypothetical protein Pst134EB_008292 [Puccinia striiformis f. sp. tritici]|nr:hypothetical protein Pst134EB_008292 [Puccinia striiformis f. sp. tritici]